MPLDFKLLNANDAMPTSKITFPDTLIGWQKQLGIASLYLLSGYVINHNFTGNNIVGTFWPGTGLALASLLIGGRRYILGVFLGSLLLNVLSNDSLLAVGGITLANVLEALFGVWLLTRNNQPALFLHTLRDYLRLITLGGGVASIAGAIIGGLSMLLAGYITPVDYFGNVLHWWMGDALGVVLVTPLILVWWREKFEKIKAKQLLEGLLLVGATLLVGQIVFFDWFHEYLSEAPKAYWMFLCVTWAGIRMGNRSVTFIVLMIAIQALLSAHYEVGFFAHEIGANFYNYWAYMLVLSVVGMTITTYVNEIKCALSALQLKDSALNAVANVVVITDVDGRIEWANPAFSRLTGFSLSDAYGLNHSELVKSGKQDIVYYQSMWETILSNKVWCGELVNRSKDGSLYDEEMTITPLTNEQGEITHFVAVKQETTERKRIEKERSAWEKAQRDALVREVHHRIKNNLQGITGILRQVAERHPEIVEPLNHAISQVQGVAVIHGLQGRSSQAKVRVCELTVAIATGLESMWKTPVTVEIPDCYIPCAIAEAEAVPLALVLNELIWNAIKHGEAEGHVRIMLSNEPARSIRLTIFNTGLIPAGFGLGDTTAFGTGLQLVAALLPRAGARLTWAQQGGIVVTTLDLDEPVIQQESIT